MKDYRFRTRDDLKQFLTAAEAADPRASYPDCIRGWVWGGAPSDRKGLIAMFHDQCMVADLVEEQRARLHDMAKQVAKQTGQRVYIVFTAARWTLLLFAIEVTTSVGVEGIETRIWYDDTPGGVYANDQFVTHYDPDGTFAIDGVS